MTKPKDMPVNDLHERFYYDPTSPTGLKWKIDRRGGKDYNVLIIKAGSVAGNLIKSGYYTVQFSGRQIRVHRIIYSIYHNINLTESMIIDHINGVRSDNNIDNLRIVDISGNCKNRHKLQIGNKSGINGVNWDNYGQRWRCEYVDSDGRRRKISFPYKTLYPDLPPEEAKQRAFEDAVAHRLSVETIDNGYITPLNRKLLGIDKN